MSPRRHLVTPLVRQTPDAERADFGLRCENPKWPQ